MSDTDPEGLADELERDADKLEQHRDEVKAETEQVRQDWQRKREDAGVPGALAPDDEDSAEEDASATEKKE